MKKRILLVTFLSFYCGFLFASTALANFKAKLETLQSLQANFTESVYRGNKRTQYSTGKLYLQRPGRFRWQMEKPNQQIIVADGRKIWIYDVDLEQVTVKAMDGSLNATPAFFLTGETRNIEKNYRLSLHIKQDLEVFTLVPLSQKNDYQSIKLSFSKQQLKSIQLKGKLGQRIEVRLSKLLINRSLNKSLFVFTVPKGVDVVE
jgi:outer membrane lipoprotein carrier protein